MTFNEALKIELEAIEVALAQMSIQYGNPKTPTTYGGCMKTCDKCDGDGYIEYICPFCNGSGEGLRDGTGCGHCKRNDGVIREKCDVCDGSGVVEENV